MRYFRVERRDIAYFRFILEAYEGLATLSTVDAREGIVVLTIPEDFKAEVDQLVHALADEIALTEIGPHESLHRQPQETSNDAR